jgi:hypothetical protein
MPSPTSVAVQSPNTDIIISEFSEGDVSFRESILALFESAARQTLDHDLVQHFKQVIASKRGILPASR